MGRQACRPRQVMLPTRAIEELQSLYFYNQPVDGGGGDEADKHVDCRPRQVMLPTRAIEELCRPFNSTTKLMTEAATYGPTRK